jgi:hypothetical protein
MHAACEKGSGEATSWEKACVDHSNQWRLGGNGGLRESQTSMKKLESMQTPRTRAEFERNVHLHTEQIKKGKYHVPVGFKGGFGEVRDLPNGRLDMLSVNEMARLEANMTAQMLGVDIAAMAGEETGPEDAQAGSLKGKIDS